MAIDSQIPLQVQQFRVPNPQEQISLKSLQMQLGEQQRQQKVRSDVLALNQIPGMTTGEGVYTDQGLMALGQIDPALRSQEASHRATYLNQVSEQRKRQADIDYKQQQESEEKRREIMTSAVNTFYSTPGTPEQKMAAFKKSISDQTLALKASGEGARFGWDAAKLDHMASTYPSIDDAEGFIHAKKPEELEKIRKRRRAAQIESEQPSQVSLSNISALGGQPIAPQQSSAQPETETPNSLRQQARDSEAMAERLRKEGLRDEAKDHDAKADKFRAAAATLEGKNAPVAGAPGITYDKEAQKFYENGAPVSAKRVQEVADAHANAGASNISVGNPIPVVDPKTGKTKMVQFDKHGGVVETDYQPKPDDTQNLSAGYHDRMVEAEKKLEAIGAEGHPDYGTLTAGKIGTTAQNAIMSSKQQQYRQAQEDWVRSKLRKESGAVIGDEEMEREIRVYFPQPGDKPPVIKQKKAARAIAIEAMERNAGSAPGLKKGEEPKDWSDADEKRLMELEEKMRGKALMDKEPRELKGRPGVTIERIDE